MFVSAWEGNTVSEFRVSADGTLASIDRIEGQVSSARAWDRGLFRLWYLCLLVSRSRPR